MSFKLAGFFTFRPHLLFYYISSSSSRYWMQDHRPLDPDRCTYTPSRFCLKFELFVAMATRSVVVKFDWHRSIACPRKPLVRRKHLWDISHTSRVIADFVFNFVVMATGVGRGRICLASFNSKTPKTPCYTQRYQGYLLYKPSYSRFCPIFRCHGNGDWSW